MAWIFLSQYAATLNRIHFLIKCIPKKERGSITSFPWKVTYFSRLPTSKHFWGKIVKHCSKLENGFFETKALVNKLKLLLNMLKNYFQLEENDKHIQRNVSKLNNFIYAPNLSLLLVNKLFLRLTFGSFTFMLSLRQMKEVFL